jgi:O-antigen/teichoic acid export membrane protein
MIRNIATLLTGNALSQLVNVVTILFVVTAYFTPAEFGRYAVAMSYVGISSSVACFRYELAIVAVGGKIAANNMVFASAIIATAFSALVFVTFTLFSVTVGDGFLVGTSPIVIATLILLKAVDQILASVLYRQEAYVRYSILKLVQAMVLLSGFAGTGLAGLGLDGLLLSTMLAYASFAVTGMIAIRGYGLRLGVRYGRMVALLKRHVDFAKFNTPQALIDNLLSNGLNFVLVVLAGPSVVGYFNYMQRILKAPLGLVFGAVSQVVFRFSAKNAADPGLVTHKLRQIFAMVSAILLIAASGVGLVYVFFADLSFLKDWAGMRAYMIAFAVWMLVPFIFSPYATLPIVYGRQKQFFQLATAFNLLSLLVLTLMIWTGSVVAAFWTVGLISIVYFMGLNAWLFRIAGSGQES